jgi:hypothetical protein
MANTKPTTAVPQDVQQLGGTSTSIPGTNDAAKDESVSPAREVAEPLDPATPGKKTPKPRKAATPKTPKESKPPKEPKPTKEPKEPEEPTTTKVKTITAKRAADGERTPKSVKKMKSAPANDRKTIATDAKDLSEEDQMLIKWKNVSQRFGCFM